MGKKSVKILCIYNGLIGLSTLLIGTMMFFNKGDFSEFPEAYMNMVPYTSWRIPGALSMLVGAVNLFLAFKLLKFKKESDVVWVRASIIVALALSLLLGAHGILTKTMFIVLVQMLVMALFQFVIAFKTLSELKQNH